MKKISLLILILSFISCNSDKKMSELKTDSKKLNAELIGIYEYKTSEQSENHYIVIDTLNGKYRGFYFGTENNIRYGILFYGNEMKKLNLENNKISFEIGKRELFENTQMSIGKHKRDLEKNSIKGISKGQLKYRGGISKSGFILKCESEYGDCWDYEMTFEKLTEQK